MIFVRQASYIFKAKKCKNRQAFHFLSIIEQNMFNGIRFQQLEMFKNLNCSIDLIHKYDS